MHRLSHGAYLDSLVSHSVISNSIHRVAVLLNEIAIFATFSFLRAEENRWLMR